MASERPAWLGKDSNLTKVVKIGVLGVIVLSVVYPFLAMVSTSLASEPDLIQNGGLVIWPEHPTLDAYRAVFAGGVVTRAIKVSVMITFVGTLLSLAVTIAMAYGLSRRVWGGRFIIVLRQFFMGIPGEIIDSARIDGANDLQILTRIVLPLSKAVIAVVALFYAVGYWNDFFTALLYLNNSSMWPLAAVLRLRNVEGAPIPSAAVVVAILPILAVYPFLQRFFTQGVLSGAIKG